ncbi:MAG: cation:proton antiporter [Rhizobiales bacterium]|nr:cation:proton antiporter [Hyphomicrobiales bacterium]
MEYPDWLNDALVFLAAAGIIVPLFHRARIGAVLAFLVVGVIVGPYGLGQFSNGSDWLSYAVIEKPERVQPLAELGVLFLLFVIGLDLSLERLWSLRRYVFGLGASQFLISALALALIATAAGISGPGAVIIGLCFAMSSTAVVLQLLGEQGRLTSRSGRVAFSVLLFQDLMVAPVLLAAGLLARSGDGVWRELALAVGEAVIAITLIALVGRFLVRKLLRFAARTGRRDVIMAVTILTVISVAGATGVANLSPELGAFLAGLLLAETEYRHQIEIDLEPFKELLIGVFFVSVGMSIRVELVLHHALWIIGALAILMAVKAALLFVASRAFGVDRATSIENALLLSQAGEFAFVVLSTARGSFDATTENLLFAVVGLSMMLTPLLAFLAGLIGQRFYERDQAGALPPEDMLSELQNHVVIGGYGRVGQLVGELLAAENIPFIALDADSETVKWHRQQGRPIYFGDAGRVEMLQRAGGSHARAFVVTVNAAAAAERMVAAARKQSVEAPIFVRAASPEHASSLFRLGAHSVIPETVEASLQLARHVLTGLGVAEEVIEQKLEESRVRQFAQFEAKA